MYPHERTRHVDASSSSSLLPPCPCTHKLPSHPFSTPIGDEEAPPERVPLPTHEGTKGAALRGRPSKWRVRVTFATGGKPLTQRPRAAFLRSLPESRPPQPPLLLLLLHAWPTYLLLMTVHTRLRREFSLSRGEGLSVYSTDYANRHQTKTSLHGRACVCVCVHVSMRFSLRG